MARTRILAVFFLGALTTTAAGAPAGVDPRGRSTALEQALLSAWPATRSAPAETLRFRPDRDLYVCPGMFVHNRPTTTERRRVLSYRPYVEPRPGVFVALAPVKGACFSSGYGRRWGRMHEGVDLAGAPGSTVYAAGEGVVVEARFWGGYGETILIEHTDGVFTRYAHLQGFAEGVEVGRRVAFGAPIGRMGATSTRTVGVHLHYEILLQVRDPETGEIAMTPRNPFALPLRNYAIFNTIATRSLQKSDR